MIITIAHELQMWGFSFIHGLTVIHFMFRAASLPGSKETKVSENKKYIYIVTGKNVFIISRKPVVLTIIFLSHQRKQFWGKEKE